MPIYDPYIIHATYILSQTHQSLLEVLPGAIQLQGSIAKKTINHYVSSLLHLS